MPYFNLLPLASVNKLARTKITFDSGGIRTHATEVTGALNQRLRPLGHAILLSRCGKVIAVIVLTLNYTTVFLSRSLPYIRKIGKQNI